MALLYDRKETKTQIVITYKYEAILYYLLFSLLIITVIVGTYTYIPYVLLMTFILVFIFGRRPANKEIIRAMKKGEVRVSGEVYNLKNPRKIVIKK